MVSEDRYKASLALHLANLLVRSEVSAQLGLHSLPASTAFFSSVDIDKVRQVRVFIVYILLRVLVLCSLYHVTSHRR